MNSAKVCLNPLPSMLLTLDFRPIPRIYDNVIGKGQKGDRHRLCQNAPIMVR